MPAPKGNQFWKLRSKHGRDKLFSTAALLLSAAREYFEWCDSNPWIKYDVVRSGDGAGTPLMIPTTRPYTIEGLYGYLGCNHGYFSDFKKSLEGKVDQQSKDFSDVITHIQEVIYRQKYEGAAVGAFNANIIARDLGLKDESKQEHTGEGGGSIQINIKDMSK